MVRFNVDALSPQVDHADEEVKGLNFFFFFFFFFFFCQSAKLTTCYPH